MNRSLGGVMRGRLDFGGRGMLNGFWRGCRLDLSRGLHDRRRHVHGLRWFRRGAGILSFRLRALEGQVGLAGEDDDVPLVDDAEALSGDVALRAVPFDGSMAFGGIVGGV